MITRDLSPSEREERGRLLGSIEEAFMSGLGLRSAEDRARELCGEALLERLQGELDAARARSRAAIDAGETLELIRALGREQDARKALVDELEAWRTQADASFEGFALSVCLSAPRFVNPGSPGYEPGLEAMVLRAPKIRVAGHFEPDPDWLIHDGELGTLGLVYLVEVGEGEQERPGRLGLAKLGLRLRDLVERATYMRHLLLTESGGARDDRRLATVELVVVPVVPRALAEAALEAIGDCLRELSRTTDCLHAIGINLLTIRTGPDGPSAGPAAGLGRAAGLGPADLRRAFSWLLPDTRQWFAAEAQDERGRGRLRSVLLDEYRLPGRRRVDFDERARLHLLHGHNGSGKSSLVEALELMVTGSIERLAGIDDYAGVVRNRRAAPGTEASIELSLESGVRRFSFAEGSRPERASSDTVLAASFRLDQTVMDRLARTSDADRAAELLGAYFSEETQQRESWRRAVAEAEAEVARLPGRLRRWLESHRREREDLHEVLVEALGGLGQGRVEAALLDALLPVPLAELRVLHAHVPEFATIEARVAARGFIEMDGPALKMLQAGLERVSEDLDRSLSELEEALRSLQRLASWWQVEAAEMLTERYAESLDEWLELSALVELGEEQLRILEVLAQARAAGWGDGRLDASGSAAPLLRTLATTSEGLRADLREGIDAWTHTRDRLGRALAGRRGEGDGLERGRGEGGAGGPSSVRVSLEREEVEALDTLGRWWSKGEGGPGLGQRIVAAMAGESPGREVYFAGVRIGERGWTEPAREAARGVLETLEALRGAQREASPPSRVELHELREHRASAAGPVPEGTLEREFARRSSAAAQDDSGDPDTDVSDGALESGLRPGRALTRAKMASAPASVPAGRSDKTARETPKKVRERAPREQAPRAREGEHAGALSFRGPSLRSTLERLCQARERGLAAQRVGVEVSESFVARLAASDSSARGLVDALNELMALFTPARWAYEDVNLRLVEDGEMSRLHFETGPPSRAAGAAGGGARPSAAQANLRLNTAQLNAFTLALFLLCAPRVDNPLGLLVLDDPLQNMDELTVTCLARGLAKFSRILPSPWALLMLFHGESDLARFREEVECGVYFLPWLSPTARGGAQTIGIDEGASRLGLGAQVLTDLIELRARSEAEG